MSNTIDVNADQMRGKVLDIDDDEPYTINLTGNALLNETTADGSGPVTVNLAAHTRWVGGFTDQSSPFLVHGTGEFDNQRSSVTGGNAVIDAHVSHQGTFNVGPDGVLEFKRLVGAGQKVNVFGQDNTKGTLQLDDPREFHGLINLGFGAVVLKNLAADSYSYKNDLLTFYSNNTVTDRLRLHLDNQAINFSVLQSGGSINIHGDGAPDGILLPLHVF